MRPTQPLLLGVMLVALLQVAAAAEPGLPLEVIALPQRDHLSHPATGVSVSLSADGRYVAFVSRVPLVEADTNEATDLYVLDTATGEVTLETLTGEGQASNGDSTSPRLDGSGRFLLFISLATNLVDRPLPSGAARVFLRDRVERTTRLLSIRGERQTSAGAHDEAFDAVISFDGSTVALASAALVPPSAEAPHAAGWHVYVVRLASGEIRQVGMTSEGEPPRSGMSFAPSVSGEGRFVAFTSSSVELACPQEEACTGGRRGHEGRPEVYIHDTETGQTRRVARAANGDEPNGGSSHPAISADGRFVAFASNASNLVAKDRNGTTDVFVADLTDGSIELVSRTRKGRSGNGRSTRPVISGDGSLVVFQSEASDLVCGSRCARHERDVNMVWDVFLHDRRRGTTIRLSADGGPEWMDPSGSPYLAAFAPVVAFSSQHPIDGSDTAGETNAYVVRLPGIAR